MPRTARKYLEGRNFLHIMVQGINKERIFIEERQKYEYIKLLKEYQDEFQVRIISYCIMDNHAHLLIMLDKIESLTKYMHKVNTAYAIYYNKNKNRVGYVYRDRFKTQAIDSERYLYNCIVYIHNNPVKAGICKKANEYKYSSYKEMLNEKNKIILNKIFKNKELYKKAHEIKNMKNMKFIEDEYERSTDIENEINNYLLIENASKMELKLSENLLIPIVIKLNKEYNLSNRKIAEYLDIGREKIRSIINKKL